MRRRCAYVIGTVKGCRLLLFLVTRRSATRYTAADGRRIFHVRAERSTPVTSHCAIKPITLGRAISG
jgi:hypothetical protein